MWDYWKVGSVIYDRLIKLDKEDLIRLIKDKEKQLDIARKRMENMDKIGKIFFRDKYYWLIFEEITE